MLKSSHREPMMLEIMILVTFGLKWDGSNLKNYKFFVDSNILGAINMNLFANRKTKLNMCNLCSSLHN